MIRTNNMKRGLSALFVLAGHFATAIRIGTDFDGVIHLSHKFSPRGQGSPMGPPHSECSQNIEACMPNVQYLDFLERQLACDPELELFVVSAKRLKGRADEPKSLFRYFSYLNRQQVL